MNEQKESHSAELLARATSLSRLLEDAQPGLSTWCELYAKNMQFIHNFWDNGEKNALKARVAALESLVEHCLPFIEDVADDPERHKFYKKGYVRELCNKLKDALTPTEDK